MTIDPSAKVDPTAEIDPGATVGPWCVVGPQVRIGAGTVLREHVIVRAGTRIGRDNQFFQFASVGEDPSDRKYQGEESLLEIGDGNIFREGVTVHRGTAGGGGTTRIGDGNLLMPYVHIAHDCQVGNHAVFANNVGISGHVRVDDWAVLGGFAGVNQRASIGAHAMVGGMTHVCKDVPAFLIVAGNPAQVRSVNIIGLERRGHDPAAIGVIREAYRILCKRGHTLKEALMDIEGLADEHGVLEVFLESIKRSDKGVYR